ncbi:MaoC family dehydratase N-terminal domain-containing protein [Streptomyces sp. NPDC051662]|uniref:MaoC family dehydratase N-terminal domain-containing protein n=1 Tax=Streptomyces sp. NPDC051662 TaxID=3154750 RepID=UPI0034215398
MTIDPGKATALVFDPLTVRADRGRLALFARTIGETDPVYTDLHAAQQAGHRDLLIPPTFYFSLELEAPDPFGYLTEIGIDLRTILHGEQSFTYHSLAHAGDTLTLRPRISEVYSKKGGALEFLVKRTDITRDRDLVAEATSVLVVRHPEAAK